MAKESVTGSIVLQAFDALGGDPTKAVKAAAGYSSISSWLRSQSTQVGIAGGAAMAIPGVHLVGMTADIAFLMHKLAARGRSDLAEFRHGFELACRVVGIRDTKLRKGDRGRLSWADRLVG